MPVNFYIDVNKNPPEVGFRRSAPSEAYEQQPRAHKATINGSPVVFNTIEEKFDALVAEWRRSRDRGSSTDNLVNDAYGQIVAMGWAVVPLLLREVENESGHWFTALRWITTADIVTPEMRGNIPAIREAWLKWGRECESQMRPQEGNGSKTTSQNLQTMTAGGPVSQPGTTTALDLLSAIFGGGIQRNAMSTTGQKTLSVARGRAPMLRR